MKKSIILFISLICAVFSVADNYFVQNQVWSYQVTDFCDGGDTPKEFIQQVKISGETQINGTKYMLLGDIPIRESGTKVFAYYDNKEILIYDFGLKVGNKINSSYLMGDTEGQATVTAVDYVTLLDGREAKRIQYNNRSADIEYIGSTSNAGVLAPLYGEAILPCGGQDFLCCSINGNPIYEVYTGSCNVDTDLQNAAVTDKPIKYLQDGHLLLKIGNRCYDVLGNLISK